MKFINILPLLLVFLIHGHQLCVSSLETASEADNTHSSVGEESAPYKEDALSLGAAGALQDGPVAPVGNIRGLRPIRNKPLRRGDLNGLPGPISSDEKVKNYLRGMANASASSQDNSTVSEDVDELINDFAKSNLRKSPLGPLEFLKNWYMANKDKIKPVGRVTNVSLDENNATTKYIKKSLRTTTNNREKGKRYVASEAAYKNVKVDSSRPVLVTVGIPVEALKNVQKAGNTADDSSPSSEASNEDKSSKDESEGDTLYDDVQVPANADSDSDGDSVESHGEYQINDSENEKLGSINGGEISQDENPYNELDEPTEEPYSSLPEVEDGEDDGLEPRPKKQGEASRDDRRKNKAARRPEEVDDNSYENDTDSDGVSDNPEDHIYEEIDDQSNTSDDLTHSRGKPNPQDSEGNEFVPAESLRECNHRLQKALEENRQLKLSLEGNG